MQAPQSRHLEKARSLIETGKFKGAVSALYFAEPGARAGDLDCAREILGLAALVREKGGQKFRAQCDELSRWMKDILARDVAVRVTCEIRDKAIVYLSGCRIIGGAGLPPDLATDGDWSLAFTDEEVLLLPDNNPRPEQVWNMGWRGLKLEVEGAGAVRKGGGFMGGGFGLVGLAAGALTASALNALTAKTGIDTVMHLETPAAELYLYYGSEVPAALRRTLAPVFLHLRQSDATIEAAPGDRMVDRLHKAADLLDRGLIDEEEFVRLKADIMAAQ